MPRYFYSELCRPVGTPSAGLWAVYNSPASTLSPANGGVFHVFIRTIVHALVAAWSAAWRTGMRACPVPRVTIKIAQTLDGRIATANGRSQWITGEAARARGHALRSTHDAILVGIGTVLADNPRLTVRHTAGTHPRRVIVDSELRLPLDAAVLAGTGSAPVVLTRVQASDERARRLAESGVEIETVPGATGRVDLTRGLELLYERGIRTLLVEGGAAITTELIRLRHCDAFAIFLAPRLLGAGVNSIGDLGATSVSDAVHLSVIDVEMLGEDMYFRGTPEWPD